MKAISASSALAAPAQILAARRTSQLTLAA